MQTPDFPQSLKRLLKIEGEGSNDPKDRGGETRYGVSKRYNPDLWRDGPPTLATVEPFYLSTFWEPLRCQSFPAAVADELFDSGVNCGCFRSGQFKGRFRAAVWLQWAYNLCRPEAWSDITVDGRIGPQTIRAVNRICRHSAAWQAAIVAAQNGYQFGHYARQNDRHHIKGWLANRVGGFD